MVNDVDCAKRSFILKPVNVPRDLGSLSAVFFERSGIRASGCTILMDQGPKLVILVESRIRNLGTKMESAMKKHTSLQPCIIATMFYHLPLLYLPMRFPIGREHVTNNEGLGEAKMTVSRGASH